MNNKKNKNKNKNKIRIRIRRIRITGVLHEGVKSHREAKIGFLTGLFHGRGFHGHANHNHMGP